MFPLLRFPEVFINLGLILILIFLLRYFYQKNISYSLRQTIRNEKLSISGFPDENYVFLIDGHITVLDPNIVQPFNPNKGSAEFMFHHKSISLLWGVDGRCIYTVGISNGTIPHFIIRKEKGKCCKPERLYLIINDNARQINELLGQDAGIYIQGIKILISQFFS